MQYAYLGFVESLQLIFRKIFEMVSAPILTDILTIFVNFVTNIVWNLLAKLLINLFAALCSVIDFIESIFNVFSGVTSVAVSNQRMTLLQTMFEMKGISMAFLYITAMAVAIYIIFIIYETVRSVSGVALDDRNPINRVMTDAIEAAVTFMMIPLLCVFLLQMSSAAIKQVNVAFSAAQGINGSIDFIVFLVAGVDADESTAKARDMLTSQIEKSAGRAPTFSDSIRGPYMDDIRGYRDLAQMRADFHISNFDHIIGFVTTILLILVLAAVVLKFIRRILELLLLYLALPLYVSAVPLDDEAIFTRWRELFIAKFFSGFGSILTMKYYLMMVPHFTSSNLILCDSKPPNGTMIDNVLRVFLIVGGAWTVYHGQTLIMDILAPQISFEERQMGLMATGLLIRGTTMALSAAQVGAASAANHMKGVAGKMGRRATLGKSGEKKGEDSGQKFTGS